MRQSRREWLRCSLLAGAGAPLARAAGGGITVCGNPVEVRVEQVSEHTCRITVARINGKEGEGVPSSGALVRERWSAPVAVLREADRRRRFRSGAITGMLAAQPLAVDVENRAAGVSQRFAIDPATGELRFSTGGRPLLGLGEGGPQFDRRGAEDRMRSGQGGYRLRTHGGRVPVPWLISATGWAAFFHHPFGGFDLRSDPAVFRPESLETALPLDVFFCASRDPAMLLREYARLTGFPELPPLWSLGYHQSHRTLAGREEVLDVARTFREKRLPCDSLIYLGTGFCPSGWNTGHGSWDFNPAVFDKPEEILEELHRMNFKVSFHVVLRAKDMKGTVHDPCEPQRPAEEQPSCYWDQHRKIFRLGIDGWWPDEGDPLGAAARLTRNRMYWEGPQLDRPNERPFALHRNGHAGMQRYASFLWSGDVYSTWETLKTHVPVAINTGLSGIPYWGTDIGGFVPTKEFTAELYLRWFQFGAFCPLFRSHGRTWKLRLPWGWNTGDPGPVEITNYREAATPDPAQLRNPEVERICRKYLELRYRLLPYLYSVVKETTQTGLPVMRALWIHYPSDPEAVARGDEFLFGPHMLVAPVVEPAAETRAVYLPHGEWHDFWTGERLRGGAEVRRKVDLETVPIYLRAGAILPLGPVKQYSTEPTTEPLEIRVCPGGDGQFLLYEDDGISFAYRRGAWTGIQFHWNDAARELSIRMAPGSQAPSSGRKFVVRVGEDQRMVQFAGKELRLHWAKAEAR